MMIRHILSYVSASPWAIEERNFQLWIDIFQAKMKGEDIGDIKLYDFKAESPSQSRDKKTEENVAVIPIHGTLVNRNSMFSSATTYSSIKADIQAALEDKSVDRIVLNVDSPGGSVSGLYTLGEFIKEAKLVKPIDVYTDGMIASAAYWLASAADRIFASPTSDIGSIGVLASHVDYSKRDEKEGVKITYIYSGKYKVMGNDSEPLSDEAKKYMQGLLDKAYTSFLDEVAMNRSLDRAAYNDWAEGRLFAAEDAFKLGLIDGIGTMDSLLGISKEETSSIKAKAPSFEEGNKTVDLKEVDMPFDPKKYEGDAAFQNFMEGIKAEARGSADAELKSLQVELASVTGVNKEMEARVQKLEAHLEKQEILRKEAALKSQADAVFAEVIAASTVSESLHGKVRKMLNHNEFVSEGVLKADEWRAAVTAELKDWEVAQSPVLGSSASTKGIVGSKEEDVYQKEADALIHLMSVEPSQTQ